MTNPGSAAPLENWSESFLEGEGQKELFLLPVTSVFQNSGLLDM